MRALPGCLFVLLLTGCSWMHQKPSTANQTASVSPLKNTSSAHKTSTRPLPAKLYKTADELVGKPFRDLGEVSGSTCQISLQDPPPSLSAARRDMQMRAAQMKGNAVLLHRCEMVRAVAGCYQQAVCLGTALKVTQ